MCEGTIVYIFGYGSLIWRPGFPYIRKFDGYIKGWRRYFWQGSTDHRGTPEQPGRVVTLVKDDAEGSETWGTVYCVLEEEAEIILKNLDYREKGGYKREEVDVYIRGYDAPVAKRAVFYIATEQNTCFLGETPVDVIAQQIYKCVGPSGPNIDYLLNLAISMRKMGVVDDHVIELERLVLSLVTSSPLPHHTHPSLQLTSATPIATILQTSSSSPTHPSPSSSPDAAAASAAVSVGGVDDKGDMQRKYFLSPSATVSGVIYIDDGAVMAVSQRGRSLLAAGIVNVSGDFAPQELVSIVNQNGLEISRGISTYSSSEISQISGKHSSTITRTLGFSRGEVVVHHNNLILI